MIDRANLHQRQAIELIGRALNNSETYTPGKEDAVLAAIAIMAHNEVGFIIWLDCLKLFAPLNTLIYTYRASTLGLNPPKIPCPLGGRLSQRLKIFSLSLIRVTNITVHKTYKVLKRDSK
jgi:hypothetical protein